MQTNRLFQIIYILLREGTVTAGELAKRFEVSPRTIYRDIDALSLAGVSVYASKGKGRSEERRVGKECYRTCLTGEIPTRICLKC